MLPLKFGLWLLVPGLPFLPQSNLTVAGVNICGSAAAHCGKASPFPRRFNFISADWGFLDNRHSTRREIAALEKHEVGYSTRILEVTFRQLAVNAEENSRYEEAANFRYMAMEMKRFNR
jgi:hypothetical protein